MLEILETPKKSPADKKEYRALRLQNGLTALLISDMEGANDQHDECPVSDDPMSGEESEYDSGDEAMEGEEVRHFMIQNETTGKYDKIHYDEFFFSRIQSGRSITAAPDKIFARTLFEGIDKG